MSISDSESGAGAEGAGLGATGTGAETGAGAEGAGLGATGPGAETGAGGEGAAGVGPSGAETGTGVGTEAIGITDTETGAGVTGVGLADNPNAPTLGQPYHAGFPYAESPYGGGSLAEDNPPTVTVTRPAGVVSSGGPKVTVAWVYSQPQGRAQSSAVLRVLDTANAGKVMWSQTVPGAAASVEFDAVGAGLDANSGTTGRYTAEVTVYAGDPSLHATAASDFDLAWGQPSVTVTQPVPQGPLYAPSTDVDWTYSDSLGLLQSSYDVTLYDSHGRLVADGGATAGMATATELFFYPLDGADYTLTVTAKNTNGVPGSASVPVVGDNPATIATPGAPRLSDATERWYDRLPAFMRDADTRLPALPLKSYMACLAEQQGAVEVLYDRLDWVPPSDGGPDPSSGLPHSRSDLVSPLSADDTWLSWLGNVLGVPQQDRSLAQWRVAMIPRPDPGGAFTYVTDPVTGQVTREPLMLYPYGAGSKGGIKQAVQDVFAEAVSPATLIAGSTVINAGYAQQPAVAKLLGASWSSPDTSALVVSTATGFEFTAEESVFTVVADQIDPATIAAFVAGAQYTFQLKLASPTAAQATLTFALTGESDGVTDTVSGSATLSDSPDGTLIAVTITAPEGVTEAEVTLVVSGATVGEVFTATQIVTLAPIFTNAMQGGLVYGLGIPTDTTVVQVLGPVSIEISAPAEFTVPAGLVVIVPQVPVLVTDHWLGDPWTVNVAVPFGTDPSALTNTLAAQQPAGVAFAVTFGVLTWHTLYGTYGDGSEADWLGIEGNPVVPRTWNDLERQLV